MIEESTVSSGSCTPRRPPRLSYHGMEGWDESGKKLDPEAVELVSDVGTPMVAQVAG